MSERHDISGKGRNGQTKVSAGKNAKFFLDDYQMYKAKIEAIDTYASIASALSKKLYGIQRLLDVGNGGVFDYDTTLVQEIVGLDLFLDNLPVDICLPKNVTMVQGSALDIPQTLYGFDGVVMVMLIHHLVGNTVNDCLTNIRQALSEAHRVLCPGGRLIIMESCIPSWFFIFEEIVFRPATSVIEKIMKHPPTLQYPADLLLKVIEKAGFAEVKREEVPKGKHVLQYGVKVPSWLRLSNPFCFLQYGRDSKLWANCR